MFLMHHALAYLAFPPFCSLEAVRMRLVVEHSLVDLFLGIQDEGTVLDDFLIKWKSGNEN